MEKYDLIYPGSAKDVLYIDDTSLGFRFLKNFSVFDVGRSKQEIPGKDKALCACTVTSFKIAEGLGVPTCFIEQIDDNTIRVHKVQTITNRHLTNEDRNFLVPTEFIYRLRVAGSIERAFKDGSKLPMDYGFPTNDVPATGTPFPYPIEHLTTKFEKTDRDITDKEMMQMSGLTMEDREQFWCMIFMLLGGIRSRLQGVGFDVLDGKMEMAIGPNGEKMIGDVFGTPDEDRPVPLAKLKNGVVEHWSKEFIRQYFIEIGYLDQLKAARREKKDDPPIPLLPENVLAEVSRRYTELASAYSGTKIIC